jgi:hypothetical protein
MSIAPLDVRQTRHDDVLARVERSLDVHLDRSTVRFGIHGATEGFVTSGRTWVRVERRGLGRINSAAWVGLEAAATIAGVRKPAWFQSCTWTDCDRGVVWRADESELITAPVVGDLAAAAALPDLWWTDVRTSLSALGAHTTERVGLAQEHLSRRIGEVFGDGLDTTVTEWTTAHTDPHYGNLSTEGHILDWEDWGRAPRGLDASVLWQASLPNEELAARVQHEFAEDMQTRSGKLAQLLQCANAIRVARRRGEPTPLSGPAERAAAALLAELGGA